MLLEQFGGANGELAAAMQYTIQGWNCVDDLGRRDLLLDIGTEELSHLEVVGALSWMNISTGLPVTATKAIPTCVGLGARPMDFILSSLR
jgi:Mn-containing catalase